VLLARYYPWLARKSRSRNYLLSFPSQKPQMAIFCCTMTPAAGQFCTSSSCNAEYFVYPASLPVYNTSKGCTKKLAAIAKGDITSVPACTLTSKRVTSVLRVIAPQKLHYISKLYPVFLQLKHGRNVNFEAADGIRQCSQLCNRTVSGLEKLIFVQYRNYLPLLRANIHLRAQNRQLLSQSMSVLNFNHYSLKSILILYSRWHIRLPKCFNCFIFYIICEFTVNISDL